MNQHARALPDDFLTYVDPEELREAIDRVSSLRARVVRVGLFGTMLYRPDPSGVYTDADKPKLAGILREEAALITGICTAIATGRDMPDTREDIVAWMQGIALQRPEELASITHVAKLSQKVVDAIGGDPALLGAAVNQHMKTARNGFFELISALCDAFWHAVSDHQNKALDHATKAASTLATRLTRLEHIGSHVRLVSLNASVEAARAGEGGKGLMVIAQEFKGLAEEIQALAAEAQRDIDRIS